MRMSKAEYAAYIAKKAPKSKLLPDLLKAFFIGGAICALGQGFVNLYRTLGASQELAPTLCSVSLVFLGVLFTALGLYDKLARHAGAGTLVPITGFANSIASPAIEFKSEGFVLGMAAKMFIIAGPVLVYGISASILYGVLYYFLR